MYYSDKAIETNTEDQLGRSGFAETLAITIRDLKNTDTYTIGLFGKWGVGKTSIVNLTLEKLNKLQHEQEEKYIVIKFEPWHFTNSTQLLNQFLIRLADEFQKPKSKALNIIGAALTQYSSAFQLAELIPIPIANKFIAKTGETVVKDIGKRLQKNIKDKDIAYQKEQVVRLLKKQDCKVVVIIDDIDRLSNEQIRQVFQLVSAVANFPNTMYLLAFDKEVVVKALEKVQEGSGEDYLQKIIQIPIQVPEIPRYKVIKILLNKLPCLNDNSNISFSMERWNELCKECIFPFITTIRDVKRLVNLLEVKLSSIGGEINYVDMLAITALEIGMPIIYEWVKNNKILLTTDEYKYRSLTDEMKKKNYERSATEFFQLLKNDCKNEILIKDKVEIAITAISKLFPVFGVKIARQYAVANMDIEYKENYISNEKKFDRYFVLDIDEIVIKKGNLQYMLFEAEIEDLKKYIYFMDSQNYVGELLEEIRVRMQDFNTSRLEIIVSALINTANLLNSNRNEGFLSLSIRESIVNLVYVLIDKIELPRRKEFFISAVESMNENNMSVYAHIINILELAYGRLAANGEEHNGYYKWLTLNELEEVEHKFTLCSKEILKENNLLELEQWRIVYHLLTNYDNAYIEEYMEQALKNHKNVARFLLLYTNEWVGGNIQYEIRKPVFKYIDTSKIMNAIDSLVATKELFDLDNEIQERVAAFYLYENGKRGYEGNISQQMALDQLDKWKN